MKKQHLGIVFIHGAGLGGWIWRDVLPLMQEPAMAIDLPKRKSTFEARKSLTLNDYTTHVVQEIESFKVEKIVIVAHSLGGVVALKVAEALGDRVVGFVGVGATIPANGGSFLSALPPLKSVVMSMIIKIFGTKPPASAIMQGLCNDLSPEQQQEVVKRFVPESSHIYIDQTNASIPKIKSLYIKLTQDKELSVNLQSKMIANLNAPEIVTMDTGHLPMLKDSAKLAEILNRFVKNLG